MVVVRSVWVCLCVSAMMTMVNGQQCLDENGNEVDWWAALKAAKAAGAVGSVAAGYVHAYTDANDSKSQLSISSHSLDDSVDDESALGRTINAIYQGAAASNDFGYVFYNDELPESAGGGTKTTGGHAKGVFAFSARSNSAVWLLHSVPKAFDGVNSSTSDTYHYPANGVQYGQSFLCLTLTVDDLDIVGLQLQYYEPQVYSSYMPSSLSSRLPHLSALIGGKVISTASSSVESLSTVGGANLTHFAKTQTWGKEMYSELVAPYFQTGLYVETWMRPKEASLYPPQVDYSLINVISLKFPSPMTTSFKETQDHSKWAAALDGDVPVVCIGGVNHQASQKKRGGGTACLVDSRLHAAFASIIVSADPLTPNDNTQLDATNSIRVDDAGDN